MGTRRECRIGDSTSHGGVIVTGTSKVLINGIPQSRIGDVHLCPIHGANVIVGGAPHAVGDHSPTARIGDPCACGAVITSGSHDTITGDM